MEKESGRKVSAFFVYLERLTERLMIKTAYANQKYSHKLFVLVMEIGGLKL